MTKRVHSASLFQESVLHHLVHTSVDAFVEFLTRSRKSYLHNVEGALLACVCSERSVCLSRLVTYLEGVDDATRIVAVNDFVVLGVELAELFYQGWLSSRMVGMSSMPLQTASMYIIEPPVINARCEERLRVGERSSGMRGARCEV